MDMNFEEIDDVSDSSGDSVKIGWCERAGETFKCVEKKYSGKGYDKAVEIFSKFKEELRDIGPDLIWNNDSEKVIYLEYIHSVTVDEFVRAEIDIGSDTGKATYANLMKQVSHLLDTMNDRNICHGDLHTRNVLVRDDMQLKIIDIDTLERKSDVRHCIDTYELVRGIGDIITTKGRNAARKEFREMKDKLMVKYLDDLEAVTTTLQELTPPKLKEYFVYKKPMFDPF